MFYETIKNNRIIRYTYYFLNGTLRKRKLLSSYNKVIKKFGVEFLDPAEKESVLQDMLKTYKRYGFTAEEYLYYGFRDKALPERHSFVADWEHLGYTCTMNDHQNDMVFDNKWKTYSKYKKYYKRKVLLCGENTPQSDFEDFVKECKSFIVKPLDASCGKGIRIIKESEPNQFEQLVREYKGQFLVEELIVQAVEMEKFHPASVNTVRVPTIRLDDETLIIHPFMRMGQHGNQVDNAGAGGIICAVDVDTGMILSAADETGKIFEVHPDSNEKIIGFQVPCWEEAKALVKELASVLPNNRYTGWDLALTHDGWKLVEANRRGQFVWQIPLQKGFRDEINGILRRMGKRY